MTDYAFKESALYKMLLTGRMLRVGKNQTFQSTDYRESLTLVKKGYIKRYSITNAGNESIQSIYGPGDVFPLTWVYKTLLDQDIYAGKETFYYETVTDAELYTVNETLLIEEAHKHPLLYKDFLRIAGIRLRLSIQYLENMSLQNTEKRLAHQLLYFGKFNGQATSRGVKILIPLKQQELGSVLDTTRETVSINLKALREKGLVETGTYITIKSLSKLEEFANS